MVCLADRMPGMGVDVQPKRRWLIVKDLKESRHPLQVGGTIKLGRFKLRVKQLVNSGDTLPQVRLDGAEPPSSYITQRRRRLCGAVFVSWKVMGGRRILLFVLADAKVQ
eukprot:GHVN01101304.1.p1 GENE.GHVN01101304.1~~GHVN01101304.1.p1  ORF type:complete len:109 (-),score=8.85 GHVN01101304.1:225-551(-)